MVRPTGVEPVSMASEATILSIELWAHERSGVIRLTVVCFKLFYKGNECIDAGADYEGDLVVLLDGTGRVFQTEGSRSKLEEYALNIRQKKESEKVEGKERLPRTIC